MRHAIVDRGVTTTFLPLSVPYRGPVTTDLRAVVHDLITGVAPFDDREAADQADALRWLRSGAPLCRAAKPATPARHLCVYIGLLDVGRRTLLLVDHVTSGLWLLPGGHVDVDEDPRVTVLREAEEELGVAPEFHPAFGSVPLFLSVTDTVGADSHTDVTFWFVLTGDERMRIDADPREARAVRWLDLDDPGPDRSDPRMPAFLAKLQLACDRVA
jgi:8-oxo-dGTP pyrophosphatase MutT (NUDIX family)